MCVGTVMMLWLLKQPHHLYVERHTPQQEGGKRHEIRAMLSPTSATRTKPSVRSKHHAVDSGDGELESLHTALYTCPYAWKYS